MFFIEVGVRRDTPSTAGAVRISPETLAGESGVTPHQPRDTPACLGRMDCSIPPDARPTDSERIARHPVDTAPFLQERWPDAVRAEQGWKEAIMMQDPKTRVEGTLRALHLISLLLRACLKSIKQQVV